MATIIKLQQAISRAKNIRKNRQTLILTGGCFDILHVGHIRFLQEAKKMGDVLMVFLESDQKVRKLKGQNRPLFKEKERGEVLAAINFVDFVVMLPLMNTDEEYNSAVAGINPDIIAVTENDPNLGKKIIQAERVGGKLKIVPFVITFSSSKLAKLIGID